MDIMGFQVVKENRGVEAAARERKRRERERKRDGEKDAGVRVRRGWHTKARVSPSNRAH